jgi:hypothetical protein
MVVGHEDLQANALLVQIADTFNLMGLRFGPGKRRQQQRREDCNHGDHDQQLQQGERSNFAKGRVLICHWRFTKDMHNAMTPNDHGPSTAGSEMPSAKADRPVKSAGAPGN